MRLEKQETSNSAETALGFRCQVSGGALFITLFISLFIAISIKIKRPKREGKSAMRSAMSRTQMCQLLTRTGQVAPFLQAGDIDVDKNNFRGALNRYGGGGHAYTETLSSPDEKLTS
jgi:hypothetical protein